MDNPTYFATIEHALDKSDIACTCDNCTWKGTADKLENIGDAILTPGDPSPAGRCPECSSLAYADESKESRLLDALEKCYHRLNDWVDIQSKGDERQEDADALDQARELLKMAGRDV